MKKIILSILGLCFLSITVNASVPVRKTVDFKKGGLEFRYTPHNGVSLKVFGVPFIQSSQIHVVDKSGKKTVYNSRENPRLMHTAKINNSEDSSSLKLTHLLPLQKKHPFEGMQEFILNDNSLTINFEYTVNQYVDIFLDWNVGFLSFAPLAGCDYSLISKGKEGAGVFPLITQNKNLTKKRLTRNFEHMEISSRLGEITFRPSYNSDISLFDYKINPSADLFKPKYWLGYSQQKVPFDRIETRSITIFFPKELPMWNKRGKLSAEKTSLQFLTDARRSEWGKENQIVPTPKKSRSTNNEFSLNSDTKIFLGINPPAKLRIAAKVFLREIEETFGVEPEIFYDRWSGKDIPEGCILIGERPRYTQPWTLMKKEKQFGQVNHKEGYHLLVNDKFVALTAPSEQGAFYGLMTLLQMCDQKKRSQSCYIKGGEVLDYPSMLFRGVHFATGKNSGDEISKAVRKLIAGYKLNTLVWDCQYINWDSHPEIHHPEYGMEKSEAIKVVRTAGQNFVEIVPLIPSLGNTEWIFTNRQNNGIAEDPETPHTYCPFYGKSYDLLFEVYEEAIDFFQPKSFHIGQKDLYEKGKFPFRSLGKILGEGDTPIILQDMRHIYKWFSDKKITMMLWDDYYIATKDGPSPISIELAKMRRSKLPKNIILIDKQTIQKKPGDSTRINKLKKEGFKVIGVGENDPENIRNMVRANLDSKALGYLQTTHTGYDFNLDGSAEKQSKFLAFLLAAEYCWTGETPSLDHLNFNPKMEFHKAWNPNKEFQKKENGYNVKIASFLNRSLIDNNEGNGWLGFGPNLDFSNLPLTTIKNYPIHFKLRSDPGENGALFMSGKLNPSGSFPKSVTLNFPSISAREFHFLLNSGFVGKKGSKSGEIIFYYADDSQASLDLIYGENIFAFTENRQSPDCKIAWEGKSKGNVNIRLWDTPWINPEPEKFIRSIEIVSSISEASPIIFAITGIK